MAEETITEDKKIELSKDAQKVLDTVEKMTVLELSELVKAIEDKFGVVAAAPVAVAAAAPAAGGAGSTIMTFFSESPLSSHEASKTPPILPHPTSRIGKSGTFTPLQPYQAAPLRSPRGALCRPR